jgi:hypothetical protein
MAIRAYLAALLLVPFLAAQGGPGIQTPPPPVQNELLDQLQGVWDITGTAGPRPIHERADAEWLLNHQFLRIHRKQADGPEESLMYVGFDSVLMRLVAFRMDTRGARGAETLGYGLQKGDKLEFTFDYPTSQFRETWSWDAKEKTWQFLVEVEEKNTKNAHFVPRTTTTWRRIQGGRGGPRGPIPPPLHSPSQQ